MLYRCVGGGVQFLSSKATVFQPGQVTLCGENERYSPPVVMFLDTDPVLLVKVEEETSRSQFLAHYSFTEEPAQHTVGGTRLGGEGCEYQYSEEQCTGVQCQVSSPGYPGIYPQYTHCTYSVLAKPTTTVHLVLHTLNIQR